MERAIKNYLERNFSGNHENAIKGCERYYQVFLEAGVCINMECFRYAIEHVTDEFINIDVTCVMDDEDKKYKLLIEVYW